MHPILKNFLLILLGYAVFAVGGEAGVRLKDWNKEVKMDKYLASIVAGEKAELDAERNDFYGGKTPDETLAMFIDAMKKSDYVLARKYIASNDAKYAFDEMMKDENKIKEFVGSLDRIEKENENGYYVVLAKNSRKVTNSIGIDKNLNGTWKITGL